MMSYSLLCSSVMPLHHAERCDVRRRRARRQCHCGETYTHADVHVREERGGGMDRGACVPSQVHHLHGDAALRARLTELREELRHEDGALFLEAAKGRGDEDQQPPREDYVVLQLLELLRRDACLRGSFPVVCACAVATCQFSDVEWCLLFLL